MKICSTCKIEKYESEFGKDSGTRDGFRCYCKACGQKYWAAHRDKPGNREKLNERARNERKSNPEKVRARVTRSDLKRNYGITPEQKARMVLAQSGACAICGCDFESSFDTHVDHIHDSNPPKVRALLCSSCNTGLGQFQDSAAILRRAVLYLQKFGS